MLYRCKICKNICFVPNYWGRCDANGFRFAWRRGAAQSFILGLSLAITGIVLASLNSPLWLPIWLPGFILILSSPVISRTLGTWLVKKTIQHLDSEEDDKIERRDHAV